ncbi:DnaJ-class molecular chaperone [Halapricum desulfuricans]|uniref:DnaJ-class molecular chaperone n=1 Tax=Halapricum desulfuricans TaxID=2841257 RepID=A0A897NBK1_9EURY|nr:J domain-containing protein [Halapricum desulfuricans]QSG11790.1 DnaJ-class molecular chaperone [Halapricum desulfuricans]
MYESRLLVGLAAAFGGMALLLALLGVVYNPIVLAVAAVFGAVAYLLWIHGTGRLVGRLYARVQRQAERNARRRGDRDARRGQAEGQRDRGGFGAGPRGDWRPPGSGSRRRRRADQRSGGTQKRPPGQTDSPSVAEAARRLGVDPEADQETIKRAYRERVKAVHPDTDGGDEERFKRVAAAYERLKDE